jgi:flagellar basal-body rod protein FlgB
MELFQSDSFKLLERSLDTSALRQKVIANNIANADTPHFKRSQVRFEELLNQEINSAGNMGVYRTHEKHFALGAPKASQIKAEIYTVNQSTMNNNQNNVDIDAEMSRLAENQLNYNILIQQLNHKLKLTRTAIGGN